VKKFLFVDLDDTLFQTPGKCTAVEDLQPAAFLKDGSACSFTNSRQRAFLEMAEREMTMIPATARNREAFGRVAIAFHHFAIVDYGGVVLLPDGSCDPTWLTLMQGEMEPALPSLVRIKELIDRFVEAAGLDGRARIIEDYGIPFYVVIKDPAGIATRLEVIEREVVLPWLATEGAAYFIHRNGNNLAVLPKTLNKARAVSYVTDRLKADYGSILTFGMGDSRSDARFMSACDYAIVPSGTQLAGLTVGAL